MISKFSGKVKPAGYRDEIAGQPCGVEKERPDEVRELVVHGYSPYISGDFSRDFVASFFS